jgi:hypothetical protein
VTGSVRRIGRSLGAFVALPGVVAFVVPWLMRPAGARARPLGLVPLALGVGLLLWCVRDFHVAGRSPVLWTASARAPIVRLARAAHHSTPS